MADQTPRYRSYDYDADTRDKSLIDRQVAPYKFGQGSPNRFSSGRARSAVSFRLRRRTGSERIHGSLAQGPKTFRLVTNSGGRFGDCSRWNSVRDVFFGCHTRHHRQRQGFHAASLPAPYAAAKPDSAQLMAQDTQLKNPKDVARSSAPASQTPGVRSVTTVAVAPTREEITTAYQSALQGRAPAAAAPAAAAPGRRSAGRCCAGRCSAAKKTRSRRTHRLDEEGKGSDCNRRHRACATIAGAGGGRAGGSAALLLAQTYDPAVLGAQDMRSITPDPAAARIWYQKAAQLGSSDARSDLLKCRSNSYQG